MSKQKTGTAKAAKMILKAKSESLGYMINTPVNREQRRDLAKAQKKEASK